MVGGDGHRGEEDVAVAVAGQGPDIAGFAGSGCAGGGGGDLALQWVEDGGGGRAKWGRMELGTGMELCHALDLQADEQGRSTAQHHTS